MPKMPKVPEGMHAYTEAHPAGKAFNPFACMDLPEHVGESTKHAVMRQLPAPWSRPVLLMTEAGRGIFCSHLAASDPVVQWEPGFLSAVEPYARIAPPNQINSWQFHLVNLMWRFPWLAFRRSDLDAIKEAMFKSFQQSSHPEFFPTLDEDGDVIQLVNKTGQWGLRHASSDLRRPDGTSATCYWAAAPVAYDTKSRKQRDAAGSQPQVYCSCPLPVAAANTVDTSLVAQRIRTIEYLQNTYINPQVEDWTAEGHIDPDNKELGTIAQPKEFNRHSRSKWKFDEYGLVRCPSASYLVENLDKFYPSDAEKALILKCLLGGTDET